MSLYLTLVVNDEPIGAVTITREHDDNGTDIDAVNEYRYRYNRDGEAKYAGSVHHRYGDGAVVLAHAVLGEIAAEHRLLAKAVRYADRSDA